ncbi:hypothetical protein HD554DRAFT_1721771 [Boletus coccyginus]|nr:hypothetical protein HD554DRAFT_1721771 [Boletus coccyginus]
MMCTGEGPSEANPRWWTPRQWMDGLWLRSGHGLTATAPGPLAPLGGAPQPRSRSKSRSPHHNLTPQRSITHCDDRWGTSTHTFVHTHVAHSAHLAISELARTTWDFAQVVLYWLTAHAPRINLCRTNDPHAQGFLTNKWSHRASTKVVATFLTRVPQLECSFIFNNEVVNASTTRHIVRGRGLKTPSVSRRTSKNPTSELVASPARVAAINVMIQVFRGACRL